MDMRIYNKEVGTVLGFVPEQGTFFREKSVGS